MVYPINFTKRIYCVITGASRGIGQQIAIELARRSASKLTLVLLARSDTGLQETKSLISNINPNANVITQCLDLSKANTEDFTKIIQDTFKKMEFDTSILFHNAGHIGRINKISELSDKEMWQKYYDLNVISVTVLNSTFLKTVQNNVEYIFVINITSLLGRQAFKYLSMYGSAKAARDLYFKILAEEESKIVVLNYSPGLVKTMMLDDVISGIGSFEEREFINSVKSNSMLTTEQTSNKLFSVLEKAEFKSGNMFQDGLIFLINLAWESRFRLPLLLTCAFMALNVRMQLEINIYTQNNGRNRLIEVIQEAVETLDTDSEASETDSWQTTDEWDAHSHTSDDIEHLECVH